VNNARNAGVIGGILIALLVIIYLLVSPARTEILASRLATDAPATPSATATSTPSVAAATQSPAQTASAVPTGTYVNSTWKFSVVLPSPYRRSTRLSREDPGQRPAVDDVFTARTDADEAALVAQGCSTECEVFTYAATVQVTTGTGSQTPRQFYTANRGATGEQIEDVTVDGHQAIKVTNGATYALAYVVKNGDNMFTVAYTIFPGKPVPAGASKDKLDAILTSFKFVP
jgi:hypothetical protein